MGEDDEGGARGEASQDGLKRRQLLRDYVRLGARNVVEPDEVDPAMVERVRGGAEGVAEESPAVEPGVVLPGNAVDGAHVEAPRDLLELPHAGGVLTRLLGVMREINSDEDQVG